LFTYEQECIIASAEDATTEKDMSIAQRYAGFLQRGAMKAATQVTLPLTGALRRRQCPCEGEQLPAAAMRPVERRV
jgi:hypothetical protein